jgi:hypothetical protein
VLIVQRWILAKLRNSTFFELDELNRAVAELLQVRRMALLFLVSDDAAGMDLAWRANI